MGDVPGVSSESVVKTVSFRYRAIFVKQEWKRNWMFFQKFFGPEHSFALFRGNVRKFGTCVLGTLFDRLKLSPAVYAVWSPGSTQEFQNYRAASQEPGQRVDQPLPVGRHQGEFWSS